MLVRPSDPGWGDSGGLGALPASLHVDAVGREFLLDADTLFWGLWRCLLLEAEGVARDRRFPLRSHGAAGHTDLLEAEIWEETGDIWGSWKKQCPEGCQGSSALLEGQVPARCSAGTRSCCAGPGPAALTAVSRISYSAPERVRLCSVTSQPSTTVSSSSDSAQPHANMWTSSL